MTGAATGGTSSLLLNGGNNLIEGTNFFQGWDKALTSGAIGGALSGAFSGAVQGYRYSKERGFNPWTNKKITYESPVKNGATVQPNPETYCYADALEYADIGHNNTPMERFVELAGSSPEGGVYRGKEVTVRVNDTKVRFDFVADVDGQMTFFEVKNGPHAGFTPNQKIVYPDMLLNKPMVYPVGRNAHNIFVSPTNNYNFVIIKFNF